MLSSLYSHLDMGVMTAIGSLIFAGLMAATGFVRHVVQPGVAMSRAARGTGNRSARRIGSRDGMHAAPRTGEGTSC